MRDLLLLGVLSAIGIERIVGLQLVKDAATDADAIKPPSWLLTTADMLPWHHWQERSLVKKQNVQQNVQTDAKLTFNDTMQTVTHKSKRSGHHRKTQNPHVSGFAKDRQIQEEFVVDDGPGLGLVWEGVGAISGGGATSKLLFDYPNETSDKILDVLFKPGHGLNLQILKVEIGGDTDATEGAEPSHMHFDGDENYHRGYEWWLMKQAKKRNPDIKLYGLPWGFPGGLDSKATSSVMAANVFEHIDKTVNYTLQWLLGAKREHNLDIDYVGLWNEKDAPVQYRDMLRMAVAGNKDIGHRTKVLDRLDHYPGSTNDPDPEGCKQHEADTEPGANWVDEEGSSFDGRSARCLARVLNRNYISGCKTATFQWHLISSFYDYLPWPRCGVAVANEPWSGAFEITSPTWAIAHHTQFAPIGWRYAGHGAGVHMLNKGGSMVTRVSPDRDEFSIVIEKIRTEDSQCGHGENPDATIQEENVTIHLKGKFLEAAKSKAGLWVWKSNFASSAEFGINPADSGLFQMTGNMDVPDDGILHVTVRPEEVFTLTTLNTGGKKVPVSPPKKDFPIPYVDTFDLQEIGKPAYLWYDQMGAWEIQDSPYGDVDTRGKVMRQVVPVFPNCWGYTCEPPITYFGPASLKGDLTVSMDVRFEEGGAFSLTALGSNYSAIFLKTDGTWVYGTPAPQGTGELKGKVNFPPDQWHTVSVRLKPDGTQVIKVNGEALKIEPSLLSWGVRQPTEADKCSEQTFPYPTTGRQYVHLKPSNAPSAEWCRIACCKDENLCNVWQWDGNECQIGRKEEGFVKDTAGKWFGGTRGSEAGWHLKMRLGRYTHMSVDNFQIYESETSSPLSLRQDAVD